ncbi:hypothetical protein DID96_23285 [Burkholderia sp. Bp8963]|nr:hypothetical protein DID96_23285 [Burkholderia sp. Bp8963]
MFDGGTNDTFGLARGNFASSCTNTSVTQPQSTPYVSDSMQDSGQGRNAGSPNCEFTLAALNTLIN